MGGLTDKDGDNSPAINGGASQVLPLCIVAPMQFCSFLLR